MLDFLPGHSPRVYMRSRILLILLLAAALGLSGCRGTPWAQGPWGHGGESTSEKMADEASTKSKRAGSKPNTEAPSAVSESDNFAAKARPRAKQGPNPYFYNDQARQIEKNLGL